MPAWLLAVSKPHIGEIDVAASTVNPARPARSPRECRARGLQLRQRLRPNEFGNALGQSLADAAAPSGPPEATRVNGLTFSEAVGLARIKENSLGIPSVSGGDADLEKLFARPYDDTQQFLNSRGSGEVLSAGNAGLIANPFRSQAQSAVTKYWDTALTARGAARVEELEQRLGTIRGLLEDVRKDPTYIAAELRNVARMESGEAGWIGKFFAGHETVDGVRLPSRIEVAAGSVLTGDALTFGSLMSPVVNSFGMRSSSNAIGGVLATLALADPDLVITNLRAMANQQVIAPGGEQMYAFDFAMRRDTSGTLGLMLGGQPAMRAGEAVGGLIRRTTEGALASIRAADVRLNPFMPEQALSRGSPIPGSLPAPPRAALRSGQLHEEYQLQQLGVDKNTSVFRPSQEQVESATFKAIVGDPKLTKGGQYKGTIFDVDDAGLGYLEVKGGRSPLVRTYQLRLETYKATIDRKPFTIQTERRVHPEFQQWLDFWGVKVIAPH